MSKVLDIEKKKFDYLRDHKHNVSNQNVYCSIRIFDDLPQFLLTVSLYNMSLYFKY